MKHMAHEQSAQVAALHLDRETAVKVAHDEFRRVEEQLKCVPCAPCSRPSCDWGGPGCPEVMQNTPRARAATG